MTVYRPKGARTFVFDFWYKGTRHRDTTHQTKKDDAERVEAKEKERVRQRAGGIHIHAREDSPTFQDWSVVFYHYKSTRLERPEALGDIIPVAMRFWGKPTWPDGRPVKPSSEHPCHDLRLCDPIDHPDWILKFEAWLDGRGLGNQSKNHYRGLLRRMYTVALLPEFRQRTGVLSNPFAGVPNDPTYERTVTLEPKELEAWLRAASYHVRLAVGIAALAPKLRLRNVLDLQWAEHFRPDPRTSKFNPRREHYLDITRHKTARKTRRSLVVPITAQLLRILKDAWTRHPAGAHVVTYRGHPLQSITDGVKAAIVEAGLTYGRDVAGGVTFHTIRHTAATLMSEVEADPLKLMDAMGHSDLRTTLKYRHRTPRRQKPMLERLSRTLKIANAIMDPRTRAARKKGAA